MTDTSEDRALRGGTEGSIAASEREISADKLKAEILEMKLRAERAEAELARAMATPHLPRWDAACKILSNGIWFIVLGICFLYVASKYMGSEHSTFSFVLVALGTAIVLYGTGTQGMGEYKYSPSTAAKLNVAIAGGAGVLTFCVAYGLVHYQSQMRTAFQIEKKYIVVRVAPNDDAKSAFENYVARFSVDGVDLPAMKRGKFMFVYVPYLEHEASQDRKIDYSFYYVSSSPNASLRRALQDQFTVKIVAMSRTDWSDFPISNDIKMVDVREPAGASLTNVGQISPPKRDDVLTEHPKEPPPVELPAEGKV